MRTGGVPAALLLVFTSALLQVSTAGDIYWEGEEDAANEFLEVKDEDSAISRQLKRAKRDFFSWPWASTKDDTEGKDDDVDNNDGSGSLERFDPEAGEKTVRVTFVVMEPYRTPEYSNRDSPAFQKFSQSLASAVDLLYEEAKLPGTQKSSLVRIQSVVSDEFFSNVTLDIVTTGYDDTDRITEILKNHIKQNGRLGELSVNGDSFKAQLIDPALSNNYDANASPNNNDPFGNNVVTDDQNSNDNRDQTPDSRGSPTGDQSNNNDDGNNNGESDDLRGDQTGFNGYDDNQEGTSDDLFGNNNKDSTTDYTYTTETIDNQTDDNQTDDNQTDDNQTDDKQIGGNDDRYNSRTNTYGENYPDQTNDNGSYGNRPVDNAGSLDNNFDNNNADKTNDTGDDNSFFDNDIEQSVANNYPTDERTDTTDQPGRSLWETVVTTVSPSAECSSEDIRCDVTRCLPTSKVCDGVPDCYDGTDEHNCPKQSCGQDDFICGNGKCIEHRQQCDGVVQCSDRSDETNCPCTSEEFQCVSDRTCIELRKKCDGESHCADGSDEENCNACGPEQWQCDHGNCVKRSQRCDGRVDCPTDRSDERNCLGDWYFRCKSGKHIPQNLRCNRHYDCPSGDFSDEQNCPCGESDFKCDNGHCIPASKRCDRTHDCQDRSDERHCTYGKVCMAFECTSGICVQAESRCNGTVECDDGSDELNCPCKRGQFQCQDRSCINIAYRCNGRKDCSAGEDEYNCRTCGGHNWQCDNGDCVSEKRRCDGQYDCRDHSDEKHCEPRYLIKDESCPSDQITCNGGSTRCGKRCNDIPECDDGEDEEDCDGDIEDCGVCSDGTCILTDKICDGKIDCADGADEITCDNCDGPDEFRCGNGECVSIGVRCNGLPDCQDKSDELDCNTTMVASTEICSAGYFRCVSTNTCIQKQFYCDGNVDCVDGSDEVDCPWYMMRASRSPATCHESEFTCYNGRCIPHVRRCDNIYDCYDFSDEQNCDIIGCPEIRCDNGGCISNTLFCDGKEDCTDGSDEIGCPNILPSFDYTTALPPRPEYPVYTTAPSIYPGYNPYPNYPYPSGSGGQSGGSGPSEGQPDDQRPNTDYSGGNGPSSGQSGDQRPDGDYPGGGGSSGQNGGYPGGNGPSGGQGGQGQGQYGGYPGGNGPSGGQGGQGQGQYGGYPGGNGQSGGQGGQGQGQYGGYPGGNGPSGGQGGQGQGQYGGYPGGNGPSGGQGGQGQGQYGGYPGGDGPSGGQDGQGQGQYGGYPGSNAPSGGQDGQGQGQYGGYPGSNGPSGGQDGQGQGQYGGYPGGSGSSGGQGSQGQGQYGGYPGGSGSYGGYPGSGGSSGQGGICNANQWRCENGPCIDSFKRCDGQIDCLYDYSDEFDCPSGSPPALKLVTHPKEEHVRNGGDVVLICRDESTIRAPVRWVREGGRPIRRGYTEVNGRLEIMKVSASDSGVYICQVPSYLGQPGAEKRVTVHVNTEQAVTNHPFSPCRAGEATCANGDCIPKTAVCNKIFDCADKSDEDNCYNEEGKCEPNQFKCDNGRCILKNWICDSEHDCGSDDDSDERNCEPKQPGDQCTSAEFTCSSDNLCIPKSYHCDGQPDCSDGSDEVCSPIYISEPPKPSRIVLYPGDTLKLTCTAVGIPVPMVNWRLNWGHVPQQCFSTTVGGVGSLTCPNMQFEDSGAYSCEAISTMGNVFATPDATVFVNNSRPSPCPTGYFNNEARYESECIRCFCFGESKQCRSADLFTYNMPTALGEGGTRLLGVEVLPSGEVKLDSKSVTDQYYYKPLRNGATVTKVDTEQWSWSYVHPYLSLPETYNGIQLTSYGGHIKYTLTPHSQYQAKDTSAPTIIIKGKYRTLVHTSNNIDARSIQIKARLTPEYWMKSGPDGQQPATREDIMMALDAVELILLRADYDTSGVNIGVNITDFVMESAQHIDHKLGAASLVEECTCPKGYEGLSCQKCASGYIRKMTGPWLGECVAVECPAGTFGNPSIGVPCKPCPCPLTSPTNQFARTCSLKPNGDVRCDCMPGYEGDRCEYCASGYVGNPSIPGDKCIIKPSDNCNPAGTKNVLPPDECVCKDNVQGRYCDVCKNESFSLSSDFRQGCARCFCSGVVRECKSSNLRRKPISAQFNIPQIVEQLKVYTSDPSSDTRALRYTKPVETQFRPQLTRGDVTFEGVERSSQSVFYWSLPESFAGDKVTAYGGYFHYTLKNVDPNFSNNAADIQLISENEPISRYHGNFRPSPDGILNVTIQLFEKGWQRPDGLEIPRELFLIALADVKTILIKATYSNNFQVASLVSASIEVAEHDGTGPTAVHVEQCTCPPEYIGTSCEDCAPGYTRDDTGIYLGLCKPCKCSGKSNMCHPETGECYDCTGNTAGNQCELCKPGYEQDANGDCFSNRAPETCQCDPRGSAGPCDSAGNCYCKQNVEGEYCDRCQPGTFGLDTRNPDGCLSCFCSGVTADCHEGTNYKMTMLPAPMIYENNGGYILTDLQGERVIKDDFVPQPGENELMYAFQSSPDAELYWSIPSLPGNRVLAYGGSISLWQKFVSNLYEVSEPGIDVILEGETLSLFWTNPNQFNNGVQLNYQIPLRETGWYIQGTTTPASRSNFMDVLKTLQRVLVKATLVPDLYSTSIADVFMNLAIESDDTVLQTAKGIEVCMCPAGYSGTSCESCKPNYYHDQRGLCQSCPCNGHGCKLDAYNQVVCTCNPPYKGPDCSTIGLIMELHPKIHEANLEDKLLRRVTFTCKYRAPEPLTIKFYYEDEEQSPVKYYNESRLHKDGWHGQHIWQTVWDTRREGDIYECHTITEKGFTLGILTTSLPEPGGDTLVLETTTRSPVSEPTVTVTISEPKFVIKEVGGSVNFTCRVESIYTRAPLPVKWTKSGGYLPQGRYHVDEYSGILIITQLQVHDSGKYICTSTDGVGTEQAVATLQVPGNDMTLPVVEIIPSVNEYYEGDSIELECRVIQGNPEPTIRWHRRSNRPLPRNFDSYGSMFIIEKARVEDSGEYTCVGTNNIGTTDRTAVITVRPRQSRPAPEKLSVSDTAPRVQEGQSMTLVCTGTANIPPGSIDWSREDHDIQSNVRYDNGLLNIVDAVPENQGVYICKSMSPEIAPVQVLISVIAVGPPTAVPDIKVSKDRLKVPIGGTATLDCTPSGRPLPSITWRKHDSVFGPGVTQRGNSLIISNAREEDGGYYVCDGIVKGNLFKNSYVHVEIQKQPTLRIWPEGEQSVTLGGEFELTCIVSESDPETIVMWSRSGDRSLSSFTHILPDNKLSFERIEVNDEGEYICTASNDAGTTSVSTTIKVRSAPEITITPREDNRFLIGESINIECRGRGNPEPMVSIKSQSDNRIVVPPSPGIAALRVNRADTRDDGDYVCTATSIAGTIEHQFTVTIDRGDGGIGVDDNDIDDINNGGDDHEDNGGSGDGNIGTDLDRPGFDLPDSKIVLDNQTEIYIDCKANGEVRWERADGTNLQKNAVQRGSRLYIHNVSKSDSGYYSCNVLDEYNNVISSAYTNLDVVTPPRISLQPRSQTVQPGQSPTVKCVVDGDEITRVLWRPIGKTPSNRVDTSSDSSTTATLIIHHIEVEDAGLYECYAESRYATASSRAEVVVSEDTDRTPSVSHGNEQHAHAGSSVTLRCNVTHPKWRVTWTKDGRKLPNRLKNDGSLFIKMAQKSDTGRYVCNIQDVYGRPITRSYINLHIEVTDECLETEFRCYDYSGCVNDTLLCDGFRDCQDNSDEENCLYRDKRTPAAVGTPHRIYDGSRAPQKLASINRPPRPFRAGDNVRVTCTTVSRDISAQWERAGTNQYVVSHVYGDGAILEIQGVTDADAGVYRCVATDNLGRTTFEDFTLEIEPGSDTWSTTNGEGNVSQYSARLKSSVELPCIHDLELPVEFEWRREYAQLPPGVIANQPVLRLEAVTQNEAGTYVCRVSNRRVAIEAKAILIVTDVVPLFQGESYIALPKLKDAYNQFEIEISIKPRDANGLILYNSENQGRSGDYIALQLKDGAPELIINTGAGPVAVIGDRPLQLNTWHTIRLSRVNSKLNMDVDNTGTFMAESKILTRGVLDLYDNLYIGGVPDYNQLPEKLGGVGGYIGCVSMLLLRDKEMNIMTDSIERHRIASCDSCSPNLCFNNGVCQEELNDRGYNCICPPGFAGLNCDRTGEACRPGLCGPGKCTDTNNGYKCACPVSHTGKNCEAKQSIEYPAFSGSTFLAINPPDNTRTLRMSMNLKAASPVTDGIIMYCAESARGKGGFTSLAVRNGKLEFRYDFGGESNPVVLVSRKYIPKNEWITVHIARIGSLVSLKINQTRSVENYERKLDSPQQILSLNTPIFVGGVDETTILNNNTGVVSGFSGCIKDFTLGGVAVDIMNDTIKSENVQECTIPRGDIPDSDTRCRCQNGGSCTSDSTTCSCLNGYAGSLCERRVPSAIQTSRPPLGDPCAIGPCRNGGSCHTDVSSKLNYTCDCGLGFAGAKCQMSLDIYYSVGFSGNGYLELPGSLLTYEQLQDGPAVIALAIRTNEENGVLLYQKEIQGLYTNYGDYILIRIENGFVAVDWDTGSGTSKLSIKSMYVSDGERHQIIAKLMEDGRVTLSVDEHQNTESSTGISSTLNADSNVYLGGIPKDMNFQRYPGFTGCIEQLELTKSKRGINLGAVAVAGRNAQRCKEAIRPY